MHSPKSTQPEADQGDQLIPLTRAAAALHLGYLATRELALRGNLHVHFIRNRLYVTSASVAAFMADIEAKGREHHRWLGGA